MGRQRGFVSVVARMCAERGCNGLCWLRRLFVSDPDFPWVLMLLMEIRSGFHRCFSSTVALNLLVEASGMYEFIIIIHFSSSSYYFPNSSEFSIANF